MTKKTDLQDIFLSKLSEDKISVSIYLLNGIKLQGTIDSFDQYVVVLSGSTPQLIYKHAISTIVPTQKIKHETKNND
jgi:host factor-I protein